VTEWLENSGSITNRGKGFFFHPDKPWGPPTCSSGIFPGSKVASLWSWLLISTYCLVKRWERLYLNSSIGQHAVHRAFYFCSGCLNWVILCFSSFLSNLGFTPLQLFRGHWSLQKTVLSRFSISYLAVRISACLILLTMCNELIYFFHVIMILLPSADI